MNNHYDDNSYIYSFLSNNLSNSTPKIWKFNRLSSPVEIQSYGANNFVVDLQYNKNKKNNISNDEYDYIEKELKKNYNKNKAYTTYSQISNEENFIFNSQMLKKSPNRIRNYTNFISYHPEQINISNNGNNYVNNNNYHNITNINGNNLDYIINKSEDSDELVYPSKRIYISRNNANKINNVNTNKNEWKYQSFGATFLSNSNKNSKKIILLKKEKNHNINHKSVNDKKGKSFSKSKNQLHDYNIDKLKEIGDSFALRFMNKGKGQKNSSMQNYPKTNTSTNLNTINKIDIIKDTHDKHHGIVNKIIMIEEKRKKSNKKFNLINKTENNHNNNNINKGSRMRTIHLKMKKYKNQEIKTSNESNYRNKILKMKKQPKIKNMKSPEVRQIQLNNKIKRKRQIDVGNNSYIDGFKYKMNNNYIIRFNNNLVNNYINNKSFKDIKSGKIDNIFYVNKKINAYDNNDNSKGIEIMKSKNSNHNYLETIYIKNSQSIKKTQHSFNNIFLP